MLDDAELKAKRDHVRESYHIGMSHVCHLPARINFPAFDAWLEAERSDAVRNAFELQDLAARQQLALPVQDADLRCYAEDRHHEYGTCLVCGFGYPEDADLREKMVERMARVLFAQSVEARNGFTWPINGEWGRQRDMERASAALDRVLGTAAVLHPAQDEADPQSQVHGEGAEE